MIRYDTPPRDAGFSLLEILVVMTVVSVLIAFLAPALSKARERGRQIQCLGNVRQLGIAMNMHLMEKKRYPLGSGAASNNYQAALVPYLSINQTIPDVTSYRLDKKFLCPEIIKKHYAIQPGLWGYGYNETVIVDLSPASPPFWPEITFGGYSCVLDAANIPSPSRKIGMVCATGGNFWAYPPWDITFYGPDMWLIYPRGIHGGGDNYLFLDGHVEFIKNTETERINGGWFLKTKGSPYQD